MSLNESFAILVCSFLMFATAEAKTLDLCPVRAQDPIQQIYLFDGAPEELAFLAPDNDTTKRNIYSLKPIYEKGGFVTARCKYQGGFQFDIKLKDPVAKCTFRKGKVIYGNLRCR